MVVDVVGSVLVAMVDICDRPTSQTAMSGSNISTKPNYRIDPVILEVVPTKSDYDSVPPKLMTREQAIANIKSVLEHGKAIYFGYHWGEDKDERFSDFWKNDNEETLWDEQFPSPNPRWGHALTCVGYDDTDPDPRKHYWILLNSWGAPEKRPRGLIRMPMSLWYNDDCYWWYTFDVEWNE